MSLLRLAFLFLAAVILAGWSPARAASGPAPCTLQSSLSDGYAAVSAPDIRRDCGADRWSLDGQRGWLFFDSASIAAAGDGPLEFNARTSRFHRISLYVRYADGTTASIVRDGTQAMAYRIAGPDFYLTLPQRASPPVEVAVAFDRLGYVTTLKTARLSPAGEGGWSVGTMLLIALFTGLAIAPIVFNIAFFRVLRERFLLWHMTLAAFIIFHTSLSSGLAFALVPGISALAYGYWSQISFSIGIVAATMFCLNFLEPGKTAPAERRALMICALWIPLFGAIAMAPIEAVRPWGNKFYFAGYVPVLLTYVYVLTRAWRRGSRAARYQTVAWMPIIACGFERVARGLGLYVGPEWLDQMLYLAIALELVITALGVADRFMILRRERDWAQAQAGAMEDAAQTDPLTGLSNRRGLEHLLATGGRSFTAAALIDIDHFKSVNDLYGHQAGDAVLCAAAAGLREGHGGVVARIGGEEFFLLIDRPDAAGTAERCRQALARRIAADVPEVPRPVSASGGLLIFESRTDGASLDFDRLFAEADRLLYAAKHSGRDCMVTDRWQQPDAAPAENAIAAA
jgi:diguanylate cyclase (GGDEF)-like protein